MLVLKVTKINITFEWTIKKITCMGLQQGSAGCKIRVHRISRGAPWCRSLVTTDPAILCISNIYGHLYTFSLYRWLSVGSVVTIRTLVGCKCRHALRAKHLGSRGFFFPMAPSWDGERAGPLANMLFGAKHGGRHHQWCVSTLPSSRRQILRCSWTRRLWPRPKNWRFNLYGSESHTF